MDIGHLSARALALQIREGKLSAVELLEHYLARVERYNPEINAIIAMQEDKARSRAADADAARARGMEWGPLHGVPMTIKESYDWVGTPTTWGIPELRNSMPQEDAVAVQRLEGAGAVVFGKSNVPLLLSDWQSFNEIYGTTNNPWDTTRTPGGSSGGAAAALAMGMTGLEIGSDIGASIRNPAHYCGVCGHKPTYGIVPLVGHVLYGQHAVTDISVGGPLARTVGDLELALDVLVGAHGLDAKGWQVRLPPPRREGWRVAVMLDCDEVCAQDTALTDCLSKAVDALAKVGVKIDSKARPKLDMRRVHHLYVLLLRAATGVRMSDEQVAHHAESLAARDGDDWSYRAYLDRAHTLSYREWWALHNEREGMRLAWEDFFQDYDVLLCPTAASSAFPHQQEGERPERTIPVNGKQEPVVDQLFWAGMSCMAGLPSTVVPVGRDAHGLPCGIQVVAAHMEDRTALAFARVIENALGGFVPPPASEE